VTRALVKEMLTSFVRFDKGKKGYLEEDEAMMMLESRSETKTFAQMRNAVRDIDLHAKRNLSFLEWACGVFDKSWIVLHTVKNVEVTPAMLAEMEALMEGLEEAEAAAEAANEVSLRAKSRRIKQQALAASHEETHAAAKEEEGVAKAHVAADVAKQHKVFSAAATAAMAARADDAAVKHKMAAFKALDKALQTKHMTNEEVCCVCVCMKPRVVSSSTVRRGEDACRNIIHSPDSPCTIRSASNLKWQRGRKQKLRR
jgi:hypothetical protein